MKTKGKAKQLSNLRILVRAFLSMTAVVVVGFFIYTLIPSHKTIVCANTKSCTQSLKLKIENNAVGYFENKKVIPPQIDLSQSIAASPVLGITTASGEKHIYVDLSKQKLYAYQGNMLFMQADVSTGKWYPTPTGDFRIWEKIRATRMAGGKGDDAYDLPNVPFVMFFSGEDVSQAAGFSLHGAYWHNNFGHPMSHGCVNMRIADAAKLYNWVNPPTIGFTTLSSANDQGTEITISGDAP